MSYKISKSSLPGRIVVSCPYDPAVIKEFHALAGKWNPDKKLWGFDERDQDRLEVILKTAFGGSSEPVVNVIVDATQFRAHIAGSYQSFQALGRTLAHRFGRDSKVKLGEGVIVIAGEFPSSGGSVKNPALHPDKDTKLLVRDVPLSIYEKAAKDFPAVFSLETPAPVPDPSITLAPGLFDASRRNPQVSPAGSS